MNRMYPRLLLALALLLAALPARAAGTIGADAIEQRVARALAAQVQLAPSARFELDSRMLRLPAPAETLVVENLTYDPRSGRVTAFVASDAQAERVRVTGRVQYFTDLPVLNRYVAPGETIAARDIDRVSVRSDRLTQGYVADAADLVGRTPRRVVRPQEPVRQADVALPIVVRKGELVSIVLETGALRLTAQGKATEDGAQGATIRVANTKSGRVLDAVVVGAGTVAVGTTHAVLH